MSSTETVPQTAVESRADALARSLFDEALAPAAAARRSEGRGGYFPLAFEPERVTYFERPDKTGLAPTDFDFPGGGETDGLIDALVAHWASEGDPRLAALGGRLKDIANALRDEAVESDGAVDPYCYTMFLGRGARSMHTPNEARTERLPEETGAVPIAAAIENDIWAWLNAFVTVNNAFYAGKFPPCPFARSAILANQST